MLLLFLVFLSVLSLESRKLKDINILFPLPPNLQDRTIQYQLEAYEGCYEFESSKPEIISVLSESGECITKTNVQLMTIKNFDSQIWIMAKEKLSGDVLKAEARIAKLNQIEILTKVRTIDVGDIQVLEALGFDDQGNSFSTLEGLRFKWELDQSDRILELIQTKDSWVKTSETRRKIEFSRSFSDKILIKGLKTGIAKLHITVDEIGYEHIKSNVTLAVMERFLLFPDGELYLLPNSIINMELAWIRPENHLFSLEKIDLPNTNFLWTTTNKTICNVNQEGQIHNYVEGKTKLFVQDKRILNNSVETIINVVDLWEIEAEIDEFNNNWIQNGYSAGYYKPKNIAKLENNWNLIENKEYYIRISLFDKFKNKIIPTSNAKIDFSYDSTFLKIIQNKDNQELVVLPLKKIEKAVFSINFIELKTKNGVYKKKISTEKIFNIITKLILFKPDSTINLAYMESKFQNQTSEQQFFQTEVNGGSGLYEYFSLNSSVFIVNSDGLITVKLIGKALFEVRDRKNSKNLDSIYVEVNPIAKITYPDSIKEIIIGETRTLFVIALSYDMTKNQFKKFANCSGYSFKIKTKEKEEQQIISVNEKKNSYKELKKLVDLARDNNFWTNKSLNGNSLGVCDAIEFSINETGDMAIFASFQQETKYKLSNIIAENLKIYVYKPMNTVFPNLKNKDEILIHFGSSFNWHLEGGPKYIDDNHILKDSIEISNSFIPEILSINRLSTFKQRLSYNIACGINSKDSNLKKFIISLSSWNEPSIHLHSNFNSSINLTISCKIAKIIRIFMPKNSERIDYVTAKINNFQNNLLRNNYDHQLQVYAFDELNQPFYNFSALEFEWSLTKLEEINLKQKNILDVVDSSKDEFALLSLGYYKGELKLRVIAETYANKKLNLILEDELYLNTTSNVATKNSEIILLFLPLIETKIDLLFGSGEFILNTNSTEICQYYFDQKDLSILLSPLKLGVLELKVTDLIMLRSSPLIITVNVVNINKIIMKSSDYILQQFNKTMISISIFYNEINVSSDQVHLLNLTIDVFSLSDINQPNSFEIKPIGNKGEYEAKGLEPGYYRLITVVYSNGSKITSNNVEIHVYPKLIANPDNLLLSPGCSCFLELSGGPSEKAKIVGNIELKSKIEGNQLVDIKKAEMGLFFIEAKKLGEAKIIFELKERNNDKIISYLEVKIKVELVNNVEIMGMNERDIELVKYNDFSLSISICPFDFSWVSKTPDILEIDKTLEDYSYKREDYSTQNLLIGVNATTYKVGISSVELFVKFNYPPPYLTEERTVYQKIRIIEPFIIDLGNNHRLESSNSLLLIPPNSEYKVNLNKDFKRIESKNMCLEKIIAELDSNNGIIKTNEMKGKINFIFQSISDEQFIILNVLITPIYSLIVDKSYKLMNMPLEATSQLTIIYQNVLGKLFPSNQRSQRLTLKLSNPKVLSYQISEDNSVLSLRARSLGSTLCKLYSQENPMIFDIFLVTVESLISPVSPVFVHEGGSVIFSLLKRTGEKSAKWSSENPEIIEINPNTGIAKALYPGQTSIFYKETIEYSTKVFVGRINRIILENSPSKISNIPSSSLFKDEYRLVVRLFSDETEIEDILTEKGVINHNLKISCDSDYNDWVLTSQEFPLEGEKRKLVCALKFRRNYPQNFKNFPNEINLIVNVYSNSNVKFSFSTKFFFDVLWAFKLGDISKIHLTPKIPNFSISIPSEYELDIRCEDEKISKFIKSEFNHDKSLFIFNITMTSYSTPFHSKLIIENLITNQTENIPIDYNYNEKSDSTSFFSNAKLNFSDLIILAILIFVLTLYFGFRTKKEPEGYHVINKNQFPPNIKPLVNEQNFTPAPKKNNIEGVFSSLMNQKSLNMNSNRLGVNEQFHTPIPKKNFIEENYPFKREVLSNRTNGSKYGYIEFDRLPIS